ncbi:hypothetical protein B0H63DRAFT_531095 [Podospora didyma]|uniref:Uncharacterized protein n=1 Tax=Podospora didyma TaxID=330526 RepID=A0AAE0U728_9PEZI|nr:hypothetical protein B0H63DRAFT_531095 [Podospora didyma]
MEQYLSTIITSTALALTPSTAADITISTAANVATAALASTTIVVLVLVLVIIIIITIIVVAVVLATTVTMDDMALFIPSAPHAERDADLTALRYRFGLPIEWEWNYTLLMEEVGIYYANRARAIEDIQIFIWLWVMAMLHCFDESQPRANMIKDKVRAGGLNKVTVNITVAKSIADAAFTFWRDGPSPCFVVALPKGAHLPCPATAYPFLVSSFMYDLFDCENLGRRVLQKSRHWNERTIVNFAQRILDMIPQQDITYIKNSPGISSLAGLLSQRPASDNDLIRQTAEEYIVEGLEGNDLQDFIDHCERNWRRFNSPGNASGAVVINLESLAPVGNGVWHPLVEPALARSIS